MLIEVRPFRKGEEKDILELDKMSGNCVAKQFIDDSQDKDFVNDYSWGIFEEESHRCLGYCTIGIYDDVEEILPHISEAYCLSDVYIRDDEQGKGYGSILVKQAIQKKIAMEEELPVVLDVLDKDLFHFYDRLGFKPVSDDEDIWSMVNMSPKDNVLVGMSYDIHFHNPIPTENHDWMLRLSVGGYTGISGIEDIPFNFKTCGYSYVSENKKIIHVDESGFYNSFIDRKIYASEIDNLEFDEFYVEYNTDGIDYDVEIESIDNVVLKFDDNYREDYKVVGEQLQQINNCVRQKERVDYMANPGLVVMSYDIKFNKPVKHQVTSFSPGGYEIKNCLTKEDIQFDFTQSECGYSTEDASTIEVLQRYFDDDVSNGRKVYLQDIKESQFTEFYLDYEAPEDVAPVEIRNATMTFFDGKEYTDYELPLDQLERISKILRGED